jgi:hypothetical protein
VDLKTAKPGEGQPDVAIITGPSRSSSFRCTTYVGREFHSGVPEAKPTRIAGVVETLQSPGPA